MISKHIQAIEMVDMAPSIEIFKRRRPTTILWMYSFLGAKEEFLGAARQIA